MSAKPKPKMQFYRRHLPDVCTSFSSAEGREIFREALTKGHMECYFSLAEQFRTQDEPAFCGLSTLVMVLNALEVDPGRIWKGAWRWYHEEMLDCCVPLDVAASSGITMEHFGCLAKCNTLLVKSVTAQDSSEEAVVKFREEIKNYTQSKDTVIVVSYTRKIFQQTGDGHFSPVGGYNPDRDLVLILDTARFKYPPHWVPLPLLWEAMQAIDNDTGKPRGYFILKKSNRHSMLLFRVSNDISIQLSSKVSSSKWSVGVQQFMEEITSWLDEITEKSQPDCNDQNKTGSLLHDFVKTLLRSMKSMNSNEHLLATLR